MSHSDAGADRGETRLVNPSNQHNVTRKIMSTGRTRRAIHFPKSDRRIVNLRGFALGEGVDAGVVLSNLSYSGCGLKAAHPLECGKQLELRVVRKGTVSAEVRWSDGNTRASNLSGEASPEPTTGYR
jgi:hypothetical protein